MSPAAEADAWFDTYGLSDVVRIGDPEKGLYRQFGLEDGSVWQLAHPRVWLRWFRTAILHRRGVGAAGPNWRQLTGAFVIRSGQILAEIRHRNSAARPDYLELIRRTHSASAIRG